MSLHAIVEKDDVKKEVDADDLGDTVESDDVDDVSLTGKTDNEITVSGADAYSGSDEKNFYETYSGREEFYSGDDSGKKYYDLLMSSDDERTELSVAEMHEDKVEKEAEKINFESWRANGGINFLMSDGLTKYEHTDAVAASSVDDDERRIFSLMYPGWSKCLYDLGRVLASFPN
ncbi:hypothetical protein HY484_00030 [Candidatus Woesearchaeota archaeon]|nr:hypothetical protein [Candidatus Woesearchaeota archaeon]